MTDAELTAIDLWASGWAGEGSAEFAAVTRLVGEYRKLIELNERLADRVSIQSDLLGRKAEGQEK
jgi:hypothetical protein